MGIISISLNDNLLKNIDLLEKKEGYSGRSEVIRAGLRLLVNEEREKSKLSGNIEGVIIVVNQEKYNEDISKIRHEYNDIIKTQIHNHLEVHKCLQIFVIKGSAEKIKQLMKELQTCKKIEYIKLFIS